MNRTSTSKILNKSNGQRFFSTAFYPKIQEKSTDIYIISNETTMLDDLANTYYKDSSLWWIISHANGLRAFSMSVPAGKQLRIPTDIQTILDKFKSLNS